MWLTAFDQPRPTSSRRTEHPNGVRGVAALVFDRSTRLDCLARLAGEAATEPLDLAGVRVVTADRGGPGRFPLRAVVLQADSLRAFDPQLRSVEAGRLLGRPVVRIATNPRAWDLWVMSESDDL